MYKDGFKVLSINGLILETGSSKTDHVNWPSVSKCMFDVFTIWEALLLLLLNSIFQVINMDYIS